MTVSDVRTETWRPVPGAGYYEASDQGRIRSVDRTIGARFYRGVVLKPREDGDGYLVVNITYDGGDRRHGVAVARLVLLTHAPEGYEPGLEACHGPGGRKDNRLGNLRWDTKDANREEALALRLVNSPPRVRPPKVCPRCGHEHEGKGRNCPACITGLGVSAARMLAAGMMLDKVADELQYPPVGVFNLAVRHGGTRVVADQAPVTRSEPDSGHAESRDSWSRRVLIRWRAWLADSDAE